MIAETTESHISDKPSAAKKARLDERATNEATDNPSTSQTHSAADPCKYCHDLLLIC